jgi:hypothetical protein
MTRKSGLTGVLADENAARVSTAPSEADIAVEMCWASCTSYSTRLVRFAPRSLIGFLQNGDRTAGGEPHGAARLSSRRKTIPLNPHTRARRLLGSILINSWGRV